MKINEFLASSFLLHARIKKKKLSFFARVVV